LGRVLARRPDARIVVPSVAAQADRLRALTGDWPGTPILLDPANSPPATKRAAFRAADAALAASGTVSLELAANGVPMVIAYDFHPLTRPLIRRLFRLDSVTLVNLVSETRAIPEFLLEDCRAERIAPALVSLLDDPEARARQVEAMARTMQLLGRGNRPPGQRAALSVRDFLARRAGRPARR
jgi:lipid-A-disaccharide synthase